MIGIARGQTGFTLVEVLVTVAILSILAAIAVPQYTDYLKRGRVPEATAALSNGRVTMEQWFQDNRTYVGATCPSSTTSFTITCPTQTATAYTIQAAGKGDMTGFTYTTDQTGAKASTTPWGNNTTCWVSWRGSTC
jgi:type IV pilus assembly protein PilE